MKKQIVFIEPGLTTAVFKIARALKLTKKYETILITFSKINKDFYKKAYDKIFVYEIDGTPSLKNLVNFFKEMLSKKGRKFIKEIRKLNPYIVQITGINMLTIFNFYLFKNAKIVYYAADIWEPYEKKFSLKRGSGIMIYVNTKMEKIYFKKSSGLLHKNSPEVPNLLSYKLNTPILPFLPGCLDDWSITPKKKSLKKDDIHIVFIGGSWITWEGHSSFLEIIKTITSQKIHFHISSQYSGKEAETYKKIEKENKYFHFHGLEKLDVLIKKISKYDFGIVPDFVYDTSIVSPLFSKITMASKIFTYMEAGLPTIVSKQLEFTSKVIKDNKVGKTIDYGDLKNLRKIIEKEDYKKLKENVGKAQKNLSMKKLIIDLEKFYEEVHNSKKN
jgi:hypothetical protein